MCSSNSAVEIKWKWGYFPIILNDHCQKFNRNFDMLDAVLDSMCVVKSAWVKVWIWGYFSSLLNSQK